jgi:hypothetical protein
MRVAARHQEFRRAEAQDHPHGRRGALDETGDDLVERSHVPQDRLHQPRGARGFRRIEAGFGPEMGQHPLVHDNLRQRAQRCATRRDAAVGVRAPGCARGTAPPGPL